MFGFFGQIPLPPYLTSPKAVFSAENGFLGEYTFMTHSTIMGVNCVLHSTVKLTSYFHEN